MTDLNSAKRQEDDLTWLARNVHAWPTKSTPKVSLGWLGCRNGEPHYVRVDCGDEITKDQWLARRAELQNKPQWKGAPKWANWLGQCPSGKWEWYGDEEEPKLHADMDCWNHQSLGESSGKMGEVLGDWHDTLERRPQAAKSEPNPEPPSDDWHRRGELPPVGTECETFLDGNWEWVFIVGFSRHGHPVTEDSLGIIRESINCQFRPLPTERERVAAELVDVMMTVPVSDRKTASESFMSMALAIYDHLHKESGV